MIHSKRAVDAALFSGTASFYSVKETLFTERM